MKYVVLFLCAAILSGCQQSELIFERADRVKLPSQEVTINGRTYTVRVNRDTFPSGRVVDRWALEKDGKLLNCRKPTIEACRDAIRTEEQADDSSY